MRLSERLCLVSKNFDISSSLIRIFFSCLLRHIEARRVGVRQLKLEFQGCLIQVFRVSYVRHRVKPPFAVEARISEVTAYLLIYCEQKLTFP